MKVRRFYHYDHILIYWIGWLSYLIAGWLDGWLNDELILESISKAYPSQNIKLYPCDICVRNFQQESLVIWFFSLVHWWKCLENFIWKVKHTKICKKTAQKGRKIFDSGKQRADGSDVIYSKTKETKKVQVLGQKAEVSNRCFFIFFNAISNKNILGKNFTQTVNPIVLSYSLPSIPKHWNQFKIQKK